MGYILGPHHTILTGCLHCEAAKPSKRRAKKAAPQPGDNLCAIVVARGLASRYEDPWIAFGRDGSSLQGPILGTPLPPSPVLKYPGIRS